MHRGAIVLALCMTKFRPGSIAYAKDGRSYTVEIVDGGTVYCTASNGIEADFPESSLLTESEWTARANGRRDISYARLKQSKAYASSPDRIDPALAEQVLVKTERLEPSLLDFVAFTTAHQILLDNHDDDLISGLSIVKSRQIFDEAKPEIRARLVAELLGMKTEVFASALKLGDNLMRAMIEKGLAVHATAFDEFLDRPRK
jgi:hypothetical protein